MKTRSAGPATPEDHPSCGEAWFAALPVEQRQRMTAEWHTNRDRDEALALRG